jgi:hypothetical protein
MMKLPVIALSGAGRGLRVREGGGDLPNVQFKLTGIVTVNHLCIANIPTNI